MKKYILLLILFLFAAEIFSGCTNKTQALLKENDQLKQEIEGYKQQISEMNEKNEELYVLRNILDQEFYKTLIALVNGDFESAKLNLASNVKILHKNLVFNINGKENKFVIPDRFMNLRQRAFMMQDKSYLAIYEIYDSGYTSGTKYNDRIYTLNISYIEEDGHWKINNIEIDE